MTPLEHLDPNEIATLLKRGVAIEVLPAELSCNVPQALSHLFYPTLGSWLETAFEEMTATLPSTGLPGRLGENRIASECAVIQP